MKALILCGGHGTPIRAVADDLPKPMIPVERYPILGHIMKCYAHGGHKDFVLPGAQGTRDQRVLPQLRGADPRRHAHLRSSEEARISLGP